MNKPLLYLFFSFTFLCIESYSQQKDLVPDSTTAKKIAETIWLPIYGKSIYKERPFVATLMGDSVWIVTGTVPKSKVVGRYAYIRWGGALYIEIRKSDCMITKVTHGK